MAGSGAQTLAAWRALCHLDYPGGVGSIVPIRFCQPLGLCRAWGAAYRYAALGILVFIGMMLYHAITSESTVIRRQARIVLMGGALAFLPIVIWFLAPCLRCVAQFQHHDVPAGSGDIPVLGCDRRFPI